jgi:nucleoid DNA-binding protein
VTMTKRELVIRVANKLGMTQSDVAKIIEGHRWELRDFGVFEVKTRASRIGRNPRTGDQVPVPERKVVTYRPGKKMKDMITVQPDGSSSGVVSWQASRVEEPGQAPGVAAEASN